MLIAKRLLTYRANGIDSGLEIRIFAPQQQDNGFACRFEIDWPEGSSAKAAFEVDAVQALQLALQLIGITLYTSSDHRLGQIFFEMEGSGHGFPLPSNARDMLIGDDLAQF